MARIVNILHFSDLHFTRKLQSHDQSIIIEALKKDLRKVCDGPLKPDLIVFSGDLVQAADEESTYFYLIDDFLEPVLTITRCDERRLILCPGNHDAHKSVVEKHQRLLTGYMTDLTDRDSLNAEYLNGRLGSYVSEKFQGYNALCETLRTERVSYIDPFTTVHHISDLNMDVVSVNTAWMTAAGTTISGATRRDERKLLVPEASLTNGIRAFKPNTKRAIFHHHPTNWLAEFCETDFNNALDGSANLHVFGHMHDSQPSSLHGRKGRRLVNQAGALYTGRDRYNGYALIQLDLDTGHEAIHVRSYFERRREFDEGIDVIEGGVYYPSKEAQSFWYHTDRQVNRPALVEWLRTALLPTTQTTFNDGLSDHPVCDVFVAPPMYTRAIVPESAEIVEREELPVSFEDIVESNSNYIIHGRQEYGKTTLLQQAVVAILKKSIQENLPTVPILVDFEDFKPGTNRGLRALQSGLLAPLEGTTIAQILNEGLATVLVDDVVFTDRKKLNVLREFISDYPRNRFILSTLIDPTIIGVEGDVVVDAETAVAFTHVFLKPFTRRNMRALVEKWNRDGTLDTEAVLDHLAREFASMNIPVTAVNGTILLTIFEDRNGFRPINRAALIERFIEHILEKLSPLEAQRRTFDFTNKLHLLAHLAAHMARENTYVMPRTEVIAVVKGYLDLIGLAQDAHEIVAMFTTARVLARRSDDRLSFRYRAFLEYFIARQMMFSPEFKDWVFNEERYLSYVHEIHYYSGLVRSDAALLETIQTRFASMTESAIKELKWTPDPALLETFQPPDDDSTKDLIDEFVRQMEAPPLTKEERDEALEAELPRDADNRQEVFRPTLEGVGEKWSMGLYLYSGVLKNMELIPDQLKRRHLGNILLSWSFFTLQSLYLVPLLAKHRRMRINGVQYEVTLPRHYSDTKVARIIYLDMPNGISALITGLLGTEKLERQLAEPALEEATEPKIVTFYRYCLLADLKIGDWCGGLATLTKHLEGSRYLLEALMRKVGELYFLSSGTDDRAPTLRRLIGDIAASARGKVISPRLIRAREMERVEHSALLRRLRLSARHGPKDEK